MSDRIENEYAPVEVSAPGLTLEEALEERCMSQAQLAERMGRPRKTINEIIKGRAAMTPETAIQLERVLGIPASFWNERQRQFDESRAHNRAHQELTGSTEWPRRFPYSQMARLGWVPRARSSVGKSEALLRFLQLGSPEEWAAVYGAPRMGTAFRQSQAFKNDPYALSAWIRKGEIGASALRCGTFDRRAFKAALMEVRCLVRDLPGDFATKLVERCAPAGVAVVFVPLVKGVHAWGATRRLPGDRALLLLSLRGRYEDVFWFSLFHEAAHLLLHGKQEVFVEETGYESLGAEAEADSFARDFLISPALWDSFVRPRHVFSTEAVNTFARKADIAAGVVVGRLQHEKLIPRSHLNGLRRKIDFGEPAP
jgi:HTH-type transcriptional regulator/antitoxin HigA